VKHRNSTSCWRNEGTMRAREKKIYILIIEVSKLFFFFLPQCFLEEIENMFFVFLSSYRNKVHIFYFLTTVQFKWERYRNIYSYTLTPATQHRPRGSCSTDCTLHFNCKAFNYWYLIFTMKLEKSSWFKIVCI